MQAARNTIMKATEVCPKNEDVWLEAIRLQVIITNLKKKSTVICLPCAVLDFQEKILGPAGPQVFIFGRQNKYSSREKLYVRINGTQ